MTAVQPLDPAFLRRTHRVLTPVRDRYFRTEVRGMENVPDEPSLCVGNHSGGVFPVDAIFFGMAWHEHHEFRRPLYALMHDLPFRLGDALTNFLHAHGCVRASRDNLAEAVRGGHSVLVYPGGAREAFRPYAERKAVTLGGRTGFVATSLAHRVPIVPVVSVGAHETFFVLTSGRSAALRIGLPKLLRADVLPVYVGLPWIVGFGPLPHIPLPARVQVEVLAPIRLWETIDRPDPNDERSLREGLATVQSVMQEASDRLHATRRWPVVG